MSQGFVDLPVCIIGKRKHRLLCCYVLERYLEGFSDSPIAVCRECISPKRSECWTIKMWWVTAKYLKRYGWKTKSYWLKLRKHPRLENNIDVNMLVGGLATQSKSCSSKWESFSQTFRAKQYPQFLKPPNQHSISEFVGLRFPLKKWALLLTSFLLFGLNPPKRYPGNPVTPWIGSAGKAWGQGQQGCDKEAWLLLLLLLVSACPSSSSCYYYYCSSCSSCCCCCCCAFFVLKNCSLFSCQSSYWFSSCFYCFLWLQVPTCPMCSQKRHCNVLNSSPTDIWFFIAFLPTVLEDSVVLEL